MRLVQTSTLVLTLAAGVSIAGSCAGEASSIANNESAVGVPSASSSGSSSAGATTPATTMTAPPVTPPPTMTPTTTTTAMPTVTAPTATEDDEEDTPPPTSPPMPTGTETDDEDDEDPPAPTMSGEPEPPGEACTDTAPDDRQTCATWAEWGECTNETGWLNDFCDASCGRCTSTSEPDSTAMPTMTTETPDEGTPELGDDNPYPPITNGQQGWGSRYWDCCKPSCGWRANASNPVSSCDKGDNNIGVTDERNSCEANGESGAFTCHNMAPWAHSSTVSYGYAAVNGVGCGSCFQIQFTGASHNGGNDPGCAALNGKTMVIQATNIGGIEQNQFDLLIPGGGVGDFNGCSGQWGIDNGELGAQYGGFLPACKQAHSGDHAGVKQCMRDKCESVFGTRNLTELYEGCMWFADWFEAADNPQFTFQQIDCPQALNR
jgi:Glycosyl hydrolase family 45/ShK domain-like